MKSNSPNQFSGRNSTGFRFCFHVRAIAHRSIFLPYDMKKLPQIQRLLSGESPLSVFECDSFQEARRRFSQLRKQYDFSYWAISDYYVKDINDSRNIVPLRLNKLQHYIIDIFLKRYAYRCHGRYIITKCFSEYGLTTCVQAYITWMQCFRLRNNSYTCTPSKSKTLPLKTDLCRYLKRDIVPSEEWIFIPAAGSRAFFNSYKNPDWIRGINLGYVHLADMTKWCDRNGTFSSSVYRAAVGAVLLDYSTLVVLEGNIPLERKFKYKNCNFSHLPFDVRMDFLAVYSKSPYLLDQVASVANLKDQSPILHINLEHLFDPIQKIEIPFEPARIPD